MAIYLYTSLKSEHEISWGGEEGGPYYSLLSVSQWVNPPAAYASPADADLFLLSDLWLNSLTLKRWKLDFTSPKHLCCEWVPSCFPCQRQQHDQINDHFHHQSLSRLSYLCPGMPGHIHHIQWCVTNLGETLLTLHRFGFRRLTHGWSMSCKF